MQYAYVVHEILQYYKNNELPVWVALLDATKAFEYAQTFGKLPAKDMHPLVSG